MDQHNPGHWGKMFERGGARQPQRDAGLGLGGTPPMPAEEPPDDEPLDLAMTEYKPWLLQRGRSRPAMMLHLRRFEPKSGLWTGWQISYPHLVAVEYVGDRMLSLDFGTRQFVLEGRGLDGLVQFIQQGTVLAITEYAPSLWPSPPLGPSITAIQRPGADDVTRSE